MIRLRHVVALFSFALVFFIFQRSYRYITDTTAPEICISGIDAHRAYAHELTVHICPSKTSELQVSLDQQKIYGPCKVKAGVDAQVKIPLSTVADGTHTVAVQATDTTYHHNSTCKEHIVKVDNSPLKAQLLIDVPAVKVAQGRTLHVRCVTNKEIAQGTVHALAQAFTCCKESPTGYIYEAFIAIPVEQRPADYVMTIELVDAVGNHVRLDHPFTVEGVEFKKQQLTVDSQTLAEAEKQGPDERVFEQKIADLIAVSPRQKLWQGSFVTPIEIERVSCEFGTIRTTQHRGRYAHKALDIINKPKSVVWATQDGVVVLKDSYAVSGNTVVIDHGMGVFSLFYHLDSFARINVGDKIAKGNPLGTIGKTGYAKGYHLHWEMRVNNIPVDPMQWTQQNF